MTRVTVPLLLAAWMIAVGVPAALANCGDGVLEAGEQCDPGSPATQLACPGQCVTPPKTPFCQCRVVSDDYRDFAVIAEEQVRLAYGASVLNGGAVASGAGGLLVLAANASVSPLHQAVGDRCALAPGSSVGRLFCNVGSVQSNATVGSGAYPFYPPLAFPALPPFLTGVATGANVVVLPQSTKYLAPGAYGKLTIDASGTIVLHGTDPGSAVGTYDVDAIRIMSGGHLYVDNPVVVRVKHNLRVSGNGILGPNPFASAQPGDVSVYVAGNGVKLKKNAFVQARVHAGTGKIVLGRDAVATGQLIATRVNLGTEAVVQLAGGCGDGVKAETETCDGSAAGGDQACPGQCIAVGQPGQCTCPCVSNAQCDDGNACNGVEACQSGHCVLGTPPACDDDNACTVDCDPATGCVQAPAADGTLCEDGDACTRNDRCLGGVCQPGTPRTCDDGNGCTSDSCDPVAGCLHQPVPTGLACSDGNQCTNGDTCIRGTCVAGAPASCDDANACTVDSCSPQFGCQHQPITDGTSCDSPCTPGGICSSGVCATASSPCADPNPCTTDTCVVVSGAPQCGHSPAANLTPCGPNGLVCFNGVCQ